jgi:hypothetical protein
MKQTVFILILLTIISPNLVAQGIKVITGATLIDGTGRAPVKDSVIVIEGARVKQVGAKDKIEIPMIFISRGEIELKTHDDAR